MQNWNEVPARSISSILWLLAEEAARAHYQQYVVVPIQFYILQKWAKQKCALVPPYSHPQHQIISGPTQHPTPTPPQLFACLGMRNEDRLLTLLVAEGFRDGGAVTEIRPPPPLTGDLLSSLAEKKIDVFCQLVVDEQILQNESLLWQILAKRANK